MKLQVLIEAFSKYLCVFFLVMQIVDIITGSVLAYLVFLMPLSGTTSKFNRRPFIIGLGSFFSNVSSHKPYLWSHETRTKYYNREHWHKKYIAADLCIRIRGHDRQRKTHNGYPIRPNIYPSLTLTVQSLCSELFNGFVHFRNMCHIHHCSTPI